MDLPATQVCYDYEDEPTQKIVEYPDKIKEQVGVLIVNSKPYPIYKGISKVGRHPESEILLNDQSVSKYHAEIEANVNPSCAWICDLKSSNKTILNNLTLRPSRFYELKDNSVIKFGSIKATYKNHVEKDFVIPETPVQSKQKSIKVVIPGTPDSLLSNSSTFGEDSSTIAATQTRLTNSTDLLLQKVLQNNNKKRDQILSLDSDNEYKQIEKDNQDKSNESKILKDSDKSIDYLSDQNKKNLLQPSPDISRFSVEATKNNNTCEQNDPSTSCESDDIFEAATQRVNIDLDVTNRRESCSSDETNIDEDAIINDMAPILKLSNRLESSTPIKNTNLEDQLEKLKNIQSDIALATKCLNMKKDILESNENNIKINVRENENTVDDIDTLETQEVCLPNSIKVLKGVRIVKDQDDISNMDVIDTQIINPSDFNPDAKNVKQNTKSNDSADIHLLDTQPIGTTNTVDNNTSFSAKGEVQQNAPSNGSVEDLDYEMATTQIINEVEEIPKKRESKTKNSSNSKIRKADFNDSLEQKLNDMFEGVDDDHVTETSMISTQFLQNVLEFSQRSCQAANTASSSVSDVLPARVQDIKPAESNSSRSQADSQNSDKYFSNLISKRKHNVLTDSQDNIESNIKTSSRLRNSRTGTITTDKNDVALVRTSPRRSIKEKPKATNSGNTVNHVEKDLLNSFEVSVHSSKEDAECAETSKSLDERDDDILTLLPEVNISGTLSNPDTVSSFLVQKAPTRRSSNKKANKKFDASEILQTKPTTKGTSNLTDDVDYNNLKKMAEELISNKNNETRSKRRRTNAKEMLSTASEVSKESKTTKVNEKPVANTKGRKSKGNITTESNSILTYVTRKSPRNNTESINETNSNIVPVNSDKKQIKKQSTSTKVSKQTSGSNMKNSKSDNTCDSEIGKESQEIEMIMNKSVATVPRNTRKRKKINPSPTADSNNGDAPATNQIINEYKMPALRFKRAKFDKSNSSQSSIDSIATEDSLISENESSTTNVSKSRFTRSKRINKEEQQNKNNTSIPDKKTTRNSSSMNTENSKETISVPSTPTMRSASRLSTSLNSSFSAKEKILFTGITEDDYVKVLRTLGGTKVEDPSKCTILVTDKIRRTTKFLSALARAVPIVSISWIQESKRTGYFLDWENYMLKDPAMEAKYGFRLRKSLDKAKEQKLLEGYTVLLTPNLKSPPISELRTMITSCGGKALLRPPPKLSGKTVIISNEDDSENARKLLSKVPKDATIQSTEFLLTGILKQELDFVRHKLM